MAAEGGAFNGEVQIGDGKVTIENDVSSGGWRWWVSAFDGGDGQRWALAFDSVDGRQLWQRWIRRSMAAVVVVFDGGISIRRCLMASVME